ncbi:Hypothetical predicted protein [Podarcis lilfordi]|uniref:Uncharacterized protein n=1 Tax=Podarcis lilfordi TaxID=74358 RepID=A0AA35K1X8_9SAUR|nr:Hypothetical predicted protein [Podarcis lilfordi]
MRGSRVVRVSDVFSRQGAFPLKETRTRFGGNVWSRVHEFRRAGWTNSICYVDVWKKLEEDPPQSFCC